MHTTIDRYAEPEQSFGDISIVVKVFPNFRQAEKRGLLAIGYGAPYDISVLILGEKDSFEHISNAQLELSENKSGQKVEINGGWYRVQREAVPNFLEMHNGDLFAMLGAKDQVFGYDDLTLSGTITICSAVDCKDLSLDVLIERNVDASWGSQILDALLSV